MGGGPAGSFSPNGTRSFGRPLPLCRGVWHTPSPADPGAYAIRPYIARGAFVHAAVASVHCGATPNRVNRTI